jgi:hypothetical protein
MSAPVNDSGEGDAIAPGLPRGMVVNQSPGMNAFQAHGGAMQDESVRYLVLRFDHSTTSLKRCAMSDLDEPGTAFMRLSWTGPAKPWLDDA